KRIVHRRRGVRLGSGFGRADRGHRVIAQAALDTHTVNVGAFGAKDVLDIPISIETFSTALMENQRARTLNDVLRNDPSIQDAAVGGAYDNISIRGFAVDWTNTM